MVSDLSDVGDYVLNKYASILGFQVLKNQDSNYFSPLELSASSQIKLFLQISHLDAFVSIQSEY